MFVLTQEQSGTVHTALHTKSTFGALALIALADTTTVGVGNFRIVQILSKAMLAKHGLFYFLNPDRILAKALKLSPGTGALGRVASQEYTRHRVRHFKIDRPQVFV